MKNEEKELLLKDLCARLPYNVKVAIDFKGYLEFLPSDENLEYTYRKNLNFILDYKKKTIEDISLEPNILYAYPCNERFQMFRGYTYELDYGVPVEFIKPYLRPMSSMTEEEKEELEDICTMYNGGVNTDYESFGIEILQTHPIYGDSFSPAFTELDWLNAHHFDYRFLIEKGLALEAPEGMYDSFQS